jgi:hypothetical protein
MFDVAPARAVRGDITGARILERDRLGAIDGARGFLRLPVFDRVDADLDQLAVVCTDNLNAGVAVMKSAQDGA